MILEDSANHPSFVHREAVLIAELPRAASSILETERQLLCRCALLVKLRSLLLPGIGTDGEDQAVAADLYQSSISAPVAIHT